MRLLLLAVLLVLPAFFAAAEVALLRLRPSRVEVLVEEEQAGARSIQRLQRRLRRALLVSQLGATLALVALGWAGRGLGGRLWSDGSVGVAWRDTGLFLSIVLLATLVAGLLPKAWVLNRPESSALRLVPLLEVVMRCLAPLLNLLEALAGLLMRLLGLAPQWDVLVPALSAGELETLVESGRVTGLFPDEKNILEGVFALRDTQVREVMVPRSGMVTLPAGRVTIPERGTITSRTWVSRRAKTPSRMFFSSGNNPVTRPDSTRVSSSPAERAGTSTSHWGARPSRRINRPASASSRLSSGARQRITTSSSGTRRSAEDSGRFNTQALGSKPATNVASNTMLRNKPVSRQATPTDPSDQSRPPRPRPAQPRATRARVAPS